MYQQAFTYTLTCTAPILRTTVTGRNLYPHVTGEETKDQKGKAPPHQNAKYAPTEDPNQVSPVLVTTSSASLTRKMTF